LRRDEWAATTSDANAGVGEISGESGRRKTRGEGRGKGEQVGQSEPLSALYDSVNAIAFGAPPLTTP